MNALTLCLVGFAVASPILNDQARGANTTPPATASAVEQKFGDNLQAIAPGVGPIADAKGFHQFWAPRLAQFAKTKKPDQGAIVFLGDSITYHWNLADAFPKLKTANYGISGDTTRGMLFRLQEHILDLHPRLIVLLGGINDLFNAKKGGSPENIAANVRSLLTMINEKLPQTPVIVCEILPSRPAGIVKANEAVDKVLPDFPNAHRLKTHRLFLNPDGTQNKTLFKDGTHPNAAGYAVWQAALEPEITKWLGSNNALPARLKK